MKVTAYYKDLDEALYARDYFTIIPSPEGVEKARKTVREALIETSKDVGRWMFRDPVLLCISGGAT